MQIQRYVGRISGPLLDRIDIHVDVPAVRFKELADGGAPEGESSGEVRARVERARVRQRERLRGEGLFSHARLPPRLDRILKVSRTIADLDAAERIRPAHVAEAVGYRSLDRTYWA